MSESGPKHIYAREHKLYCFSNISTLIVSISLPLTVLWPPCFSKSVQHFFSFFGAWRVLAHWRLKKQLLGPRPLWSATLLSFWGGG